MHSSQASSSFTGAIPWIVAATSFGFVVVQLDVTVVNVALPHISAGIGASVAELQWVVDAYSLAFAVLLLSAGVLADRFGSRRAYVTGFLIFVSASLACGLAPNADVLITARTVQGFGAALLVPSSLALLNDACAHDDAMRARAVGLWTAAGGVAIAAGPVFGGVLLRILGWRSIFLVNVPVCAIGVALTLRYVPAMTAGGEMRTQRRGLDLAGQLLAIVTLTGLTGAVIELKPLGLYHPLVVGGFVLALGGSIAFIAVEARVREPMLPLTFFRLPNFSAAVVFGVFINFTLYGILFVLSLYLQQARGYSALETGLAYLPLMSTVIVANIVSGWMSARLGLRTPMIVGASIGAIGFALLHGFDGRTSYLAMLPAFLFIPSGIGLAVPAMTTAILASVERERAGTASAVLNTARQAGGAIGVAVCGAVASGAGEQIVNGLQVSALVSFGLLVTATLLAWLGIQQKGVPTASS